MYSNVEESVCSEFLFLNLPIVGYVMLYLLHVVLQAEQLKTEGNKAYKDGDLQLALRLYNKALQHDPGNHAVYGNRSMVYGILKMYEKALEDAEMAIQLKPDWLKVRMYVLMRLCSLKYRCFIEDPG